MSVLEWDCRGAGRQSASKPTLASAASQETGRPSTTSAPPWLQPTLEKIFELFQLGPNWDGRGSAGVNTDVLWFACEVLRRVMFPKTIPPSLIPLGHGGVQLVWSNSSTEVEVEITKPNDVLVYAFDRATGKEEEWPADTDFSDLEAILKSKFTN